MGGERTAAHSWSGAALEGFCSALPPACAPGSSCARAIAAKDSVCNHETLHSGASPGEGCACVPAVNRRALRRHCLRARAGGAGMAPGRGGFGAPGHARAKREKGDLRSPATAPGTIGVRPLTFGAGATGGICFFAEKNTEALHDAGDSGQPDGVAGDSAAREGTRPKIRQAAGGVHEGVGTEKRNARPGGVYRVSGLLRSGWGSGEPGRRRAGRRGAIDDRPWSEGPGVSAGVSVACEQPRLSGNREVPCVRIPGGANERGRPRGAVSYPGRAAAVLRCANARGRTADHKYRDGEKGKSAGVHRGHRDGTGDKTAGRAPNHAEAACCGKRGSCAAGRLARCAALLRRGGTGKDFFADRGLGGTVSPTVTGAPDAQSFGAERLPDLPATISVRVLVVAAGRAEGGEDFWGRDAHDDQAFCGSIAQGSEAALRRSAKNF